MKHGLEARLRKGFGKATRIATAGTQDDFSVFMCNGGPLGRIEYSAKRPTELNVRLQALSREEALRFLDGVYDAIHDVAVDRRITPLITPETVVAKEVLTDWHYRPLPHDGRYIRTG